MNNLSADQKKTIYKDCCDTMRSEYFSYRQFEGAAIKIAETGAYETAGYSSFLSFYKAEFGDAHSLSSRKYQLLKYAEVVADVALAAGAQGSLVENIFIPGTERQARALAPLPPEDRGPAWQLAQETTGKEQPSSAEVAATVAALRPTDERIGRLDTDRTARPKPEVQGRSFRGGFRVSDFKFDPNMRQFHFEVFKPANTFKGYAAKKEHLRISLTDLEWELRNVGFDLVRAGGAQADQSGADVEDDEPVDATGEQADPADVALTLDLPADVDVGVRATIAKERRRIAAFTNPPADDEEAAPASFVTTDLSYLDEAAQLSPVGTFFADYPQ